MAISNSSFQYLQKQVGSWSGIALTEKDKYLVEARLLPLARQHQLPTVEELIGKARDESANGVSALVLDALLPMETFFFRDIHPFELLRSKIFPTLEAARFRECKLNIWCAGCSGGQEAYSIAMVLHRYFSHLMRWKVDILATDISRRALAQAQEGRFDEVEVHRGVQPVLIKEYFRLKGAHYIVKDDVGQLIVVQELNLVGDWAGLPPVDVVFMRNVLRYMTPEAQRQILQKLKSVLRPDGYLFLGGQESASELDPAYRLIVTEKSGYYQLSRGEARP